MEQQRRQRTNDEDQWQSLEGQNKRRGTFFGHEGGISTAHIPKHERGALAGCGIKCANTTSQNSKDAARGFQIQQRPGQRELKRHA